MAGHALQKHAGRNPNIWGKVSENSETINNSAMQHIEDILHGSGDFKIVTSNGRSFLEISYLMVEGFVLIWMEHLKVLLIK